VSPPWAAIGVPIDSVGRAGGTEHAPAAAREHDLLARLGAEDRGDLDVRIRGEERDPGSGVIGLPDTLSMTAIVRDAVRETVAGGARPLLIGGCCALVPGALAGLRDAVGTLGVAYVDGHVDVYDGTTSPTGEGADMPMSVAFGLGPDELRAAGLAVAGARAAERLAAGGGRFWIHLDVDVLDEREMPATDYLMPDGLDWDELVALLGPLGASPGLAGLSLGCLNPEKDPDGAYTERTCALLASALAPA
jgi:arginase